MSQKRQVWIPDPIEIAISLTLVVILWATVFTAFNVEQTLLSWGGGLWNLLGFMTQMCLVLLTGYILAVSPPVRAFLSKIVGVVQTDRQAYFFTFFISALACWLNWGLGLVTGAFLTLEMARHRPRINYPLLVSVSYMGFLFWHGGLSGSIPLTVATPENFSEKFVGGTLPLKETLFSPFNIALLLTLFLSLCVLIFCLEKFSKNKKVTSYVDQQKEGPSAMSTDLPGITFSKGNRWILILLCASYLVFQLKIGFPVVGLNEVNFFLFLLGLACHSSLQSFMVAVKEGGSKITPILVLYPLYSGIMAVIVDAGIGAQISEFFVGISTESTYNLFIFWSAGLLNLFVPSGGGQWAVQAPIVVDGAKLLSLPLQKTVMAVAWGDAWTNMAQPFWAIPLLSIVNLSVKDILGYCLWALLVSGVVMSFFFVFV